MSRRNFGAAPRQLDGRFSDHRAFAQIELTVVLVVVSLLVGLALIAAPHIRESSRQTDCTNRMRQVVLGAHKFHESMKRLPPAAIHMDLVMESDTFYEDLRDTQWTSALALCLPYLDMEVITKPIPEIAFDMYTVLSKDSGRNPTYSWPGEIDNVGVVLATRIPLFECPSDNINDICYPQSGGACDNSLAAYVPRWNGEEINDSDWAGYLVNLPGDRRVYRTNFVSCIGAHGHQLDPERNRWKGCMTTRGRVTLETIVDGTSRTIMFGENIGGIFAGRRGLDLDDDDVTRTSSGWAWSWFWGGTAQARGNIPYGDARLTTEIVGYTDNDLEPVLPHAIPMLGNSKFSSTKGFGSMHPKGVNIAFADGSVLKLKRSIHWYTLYQLASARDSYVPIGY